MLRIREENDEEENPQKNMLFVSVFKIMSFKVLKITEQVLNELTLR